MGAVGDLGDRETPIFRMEGRRRRGLGAASREQTSALSDPAPSY